MTAATIADGRMYALSAAHSTLLTIDLAKRQVIAAHAIAGLTRPTGLAIKGSDFYVVDDAGHVNEDVFAYSNRSGGERTLVIYHNRFGSMRGRIRDSVAYAVKDDGGAKHLVRTSLADGLGIPIEQRDPREITHGFGRQTAPEGVKVYNPAFDVTPTRLLTGLVTERGVCEAPFSESLRRVAGA